MLSGWLHALFSYRVVAPNLTAFVVGEATIKFPLLYVTGWIRLSQFSRTRPSELSPLISVRETKVHCLVLSQFDVQYWHWPTAIQSVSLCQSFHLRLLLRQSERPSAEWRTRTPGLSRAYPLLSPHSIVTEHTRQLNSNPKIQRC